MKHHQETGGVAIEALLECLFILIIVPPLVTCAVQAILALVNIVVPWLALVVIVFIVVAAIVTIITARPRREKYIDADSVGDLPLLSPIDRPKAPKRRKEDDEVR